MDTNEKPEAKQLQRKRGRPPRDIMGILDAAVAVFAREGYAAATIEMIAAEASASTATLYKRFTNKHGLFVAVLQKTTSRSLAIHIDNRGAKEHAFSSLISRIEAHAIVSTDPQVRGVMRAWISEVRNHSELSELFAVNAGRELVTALMNQLVKLGDMGLVDLPSSDSKQLLFAAQTMLGVLERFTLTRGLVLGDNIKPIFSARGIAEKSVHAMIGIWGTPAGIAAFNDFPKANLDYEEPS
jgi:AcrR family transcriptional regulator